MGNQVGTPAPMTPRTSFLHPEGLVGARSTRHHLGAHVPLQVTCLLKRIPHPAGHLLQPQPRLREPLQDGGQSPPGSHRVDVSGLGLCAGRRLPRPSAMPSAHRLDAELADGVIHQDHAVLHAHPDVSVRPAALVRPVLIALLLQGQFAETTGPWVPFLTSSPSPAPSTRGPARLQ